MRDRWLAGGLVCGVLAAGCAAPPPAHGPMVSVPAAVAPIAPIAAAPRSAPPTLDNYKVDVARQIAGASAEVFDEPLPEMLKSVVVLDVTIGRDGRLLRVAVLRSNGYKALEARALESVRRAAPFAAPAASVRRADGTVNFLETFLFRDDGRFRIRSIVASG